MCPRPLQGPGSRKDQEAGRPLPSLASFDLSVAVEPGPDRIDLVSFLGHSRPCRATSGRTFVRVGRQFSSSTLASRSSDFSPAGTSRVVADEQVHLAGLAFCARGALASRSGSLPVPSTNPPPRLPFALGVALDGPRRARRLAQPGPPKNADDDPGSPIFQLLGLNAERQAPTRTAPSSAPKDLRGESHDHGASNLLVVVFSR